MLLTTVAGIREALGFADMTDINAAIAQALHGATPQLESFLGSRFTRATVEDIFWVRESAYKSGPHSHTEFRLSRGFLAAAPTITVGPTLATLASTTETFKSNLEKGIVKNIGYAFAEEYVQFDYAAGFEADDTDPEIYDLDQVPGWLQECAKLLCMRDLASSPSLDTAGVDLDVKTLNTALHAIITERIRYAPAAILPI